MKLYLYLAAALGAIALAVGAYFYGVGVGVDRQVARDAKAMAKAQAALNKGLAAMRRQDLDAAGADVDRQTIQREIIREVPKIIERPVYRAVCIDDGGVQLLRRAVAAANGAADAGGGSDGDPGRVQ